MDAVTLCDHRTRFMQSGIIFALFADLLAQAKDKGLISEDRLQIVDSFMVGGAGAVQDTYTLLRKGIVRLLRVAEFHELRSRLEPVLARQDYGVDSKPKINWDDPEEKRKLLESYVIDARNLVATVRALRPLPKNLSDASDLLERIASQDIDNGDGQVKMKKGVAKDRVISVTDPDMRHGRKTSSAKANGFKAHIATDGDFVTSVVITAANKPDTEPLPEVLKQCEANGVKPKQVMGDSAYCIWLIKENMALDGIELIAKAPSEARVYGRYPKSMFDIDTLAGVVRCPEGSQARSGPSVIKSRTGAVVCLSDCAACPSRTECTRAKVGRTISVHPYEPEMAAEREKQDTAEFKEFCVQRSDGERVIGHLTRHGARDAGYIGILKVWCQEILAALNFNIKAFAGLSAATTG
ncbi:MAG: transposase [Clostridia bacterium]|nr:transposase [Clostridia bacterium]